MTWRSLLRQPVCAFSIALMSELSLTINLVLFNRELRWHLGCGILLYLQVSFHPGPQQGISGHRRQHPVTNIVTAYQIISTVLTKLFLSHGLHKWPFVSHTRLIEQTFFNHHGESIRRSHVSNTGDSASFSGDFGTHVSATRIFTPSSSSYIFSCWEQHWCSYPPATQWQQRTAR